MAGLDGFDRLKRALVAIVDHRMRRVDYLALYPARVAAQNEDGTLELVPDGTRFKGMSRVPLRLGLPGVTVRVRSDSRVLVGFEAGDASRPYASVWDTASVESIEVTAKTKVVIDAPSIELGGEGGGPIARAGDTVTCVLPPTMPVSGTVNGVQPFVGVITIVDPVLGVINDGALRAKAT